MRFRIICMAMLLTGIFSPGSWADSGPIKAGDVLPDFRLMLPEDADILSYLGLTEKKDGDAGYFNMSDIRGKMILIEIFSMYCPHCQREAPDVNTLFEQLKKESDIKMIGIGVGNSEYEVNFFKKKYDVRFPLFPDPDYEIHHQLKEPRTPYFIGAYLAPDASLKVCFSHLGGIDSVNDFLKKIIESSRLNKGGKK